MRNASQDGAMACEVNRLTGVETQMGTQHVGNGANREIVYRSVCPKTWLLWGKLNCFKSSGTLETSPPATPRLRSRLGCSAVVLPSRERSQPRTRSMRPDMPRTDTLRQPDNVTYDRTAGSPTGRETYGDGVLIVVGGVTSTQGDWESQSQGEGGQERRAEALERYANANS
jgi:hypothetical protein